MSSGNLHHTLELGGQDAFSALEPLLSRQKIPKLRHKKEQERPQYDILQIDEQIRAAFQAENSKLPEYDKRIASMIKALINIPVPFGTSEAIREDIEKIQNKYIEEMKVSEAETSSSSSGLSFSYQEFLEFYQNLKRLILKKHNLESGNLQSTYEKLTCGLLQEYKQILNTPLKTSFLASKKARTENGSEKRKREIVEGYLKIASDFTDLQYIPEIPISSGDKYVCPCGNGNDFEVREGVTICENCGVETETISIQSSFRDIDRINTHTKYKYEKSFHFREAIAQFEGKQNKYIDPSIYARIDEWAKRHNLLHMECENRKERYRDMTKSHLRLMFSESKDKTLTDHHEDIHLIFSELTGNPCPDISHLKERLNNWFDLIEQAFYASPDIGRTNILHGPFLLAKFLRMCNYPVTADDFPGLKTLTRQQDHETLFTYLCAKAGLNHPDDIACGRKQFVKSGSR